MEEAKTHLKDYMRGYLRNDPTGVATQLAQVKNWEDRASEELNKRATRIIESLPDEILAAIAPAKSAYRK